MTARRHAAYAPLTQVRRPSVERDTSRLRGAPAAPRRDDVRREHLTLPPQPESVHAARHFLKVMLLEWGLHAVSDTVELAASELLTNAVMHARTSFDVTVVVALDDLTVSVRDTGGSFPARCEERDHAPAWDSEGGRGLMIVAAVADDWGATADGSSTTVWFRIRLPGS